MIITITNYHHPKTKYMVTDTSFELNFPDLPEDCSLVFKNRYTKKTEVFSNEKLVKLFENNGLCFDIKLFNFIFMLDPNEFRFEVIDHMKTFISNIGKIQKNKIQINNILDFVNKPTGFCLKNDVDSDLDILTNKLNLIEIKLSSFKEISKKKDIESELQNLEDLINSYVS